MNHKFAIIRDSLSKRYGQKYSKWDINKRCRFLGLPPRGVWVPKRMPLPETEVIKSDIPGVLITELRESSCRYIINDEPTMYCGGKITRGSYCVCHAKLCYRDKD